MPVDLTTARRFAWRIALIGTGVTAAAIVILVLVGTAVAMARPDMPAALPVFAGMLGFALAAAAVVAGFALCVVLTLNHAVFPQLVRNNGPAVGRATALWQFIGVWIAAIFLTSIGSAVFTDESFIPALIGVGSLSLLPFFIFLLTAMRVWPRAGAEHG